jgi:hypothetical protein
VTKVRTEKTISIEKSFVPGKRLSSLSGSISSMLIIYLIYIFISGIFSFIPSWWLIFFLCFYKVVVVNDCRFDKLDGLCITWMITT